MERMLIRSRSGRRVHRIQAGQHAAVGVALIAASAGAWSSGRPSWPDYVGLLGGVGMLLAFAASLSPRDAAGEDTGAPAHTVDWVDIAAAVVTGVESWHLHHQGRRGLPVAYGVLAVVLLVVGLGHARIAAWRRLQVTEHGFDVRLSPRVRVRRSWSDVSAVRRDGTAVVVEGRHGDVARVDLADAINADALIDALLAAASRHLHMVPVDEGAAGVVLLGKTADGPSARLAHQGGELVEGTR